MKAKDLELNSVLMLESKGTNKLFVRGLPREHAPGVVARRLFSRFWGDELHLDDDFTLVNEEKEVFPIDLTI